MDWKPECDLCGSDEDVKGSCTVDEPNEPYRDDLFMCACCRDDYHNKEKD